MLYCKIALLINKERKHGQLVLCTPCSENLGPVVLVLYSLYVEFKEAGWSANYPSNLLKNEIFGQNFDLLKKKKPNILAFELEYFLISLL